MQQQCVRGELLTLPYCRQLLKRIMTCHYHRVCRYLRSIRQEEQLPCVYKQDKYTDLNAMEAPVCNHWTSTTWQAYKPMQTQDDANWLWFA